MSDESNGAGNAAGNENDDAQNQNPGANDGADNDGDPAGADSLGDAGKKALDAMKAERNTFKSQVREWNSFARELGANSLAELKAKLADAGKGETPKTDDKGPSAEEIRKQAKAEAAAEALRDRALDRVVAKAAGKLGDPEDARAYLASKVEDFIGADGKDLDNEAIADAIDDLVKKKPYLAAQGGRRFGGSGDGGARNGGRGPSQLSRADLQKMSAAEISKARKEGRLNDLMGGR